MKNGVWQPGSREQTYSVLLGCHCPRPSQERVFTTHSHWSLQSGSPDINPSPPLFHHISPPFSQKTLVPNTRTGAHLLHPKTRPESVQNYPNLSTTNLICSTFLRHSFFSSDYIPLKEYRVLLCVTGITLSYVVMLLIIIQYTDTSRFICFHLNSIVFFYQCCCIFSRCRIFIYMTQKVRII